MTTQASGPGATSSALSAVPNQPAATTPPEAHATSAAQSLAGVPFGRLLGVELRKMVDTRSGRWLLVVIVGLALVILAALVIWGPGQGRSFKTYFQQATLPVGMLVPVIGILTMTAEWSQRTALVTFSLEPRRLRVLAAKAVAALLITTAVFAVVAAVTAVTLAVSGAVHPEAATWAVPGREIAGMLASYLVNTLMGLAFGLLLANSSVAIVLYFLIPTVVSLLSAWDPARPVLKWLDPNAIIQALTAPDVGTDGWQHAGVAFGVWVVLPLLAGTVLTLRREVK